MQWWRLIRRENGYAVLAILSLSFLAWYHWGMKVTHRIDLDVPGVTMMNDVINGGNSLGHFVQREQTLSFSCQTRRSNTFPFCSVVIPTSPRAIDGLDLRRFHSVNIKLSYSEASDLKDSVLVYLLNAERDTISTATISRANLQTIIPVNQPTYSYTLPIANFYVPSWWSFLHAKISDHSARLDNVTDIQIATGDSHARKNTTITIRAVEFVGKWLTLLEVQFLLVAGWVLAVTVDVLTRLVALKRSLQANQSRASFLDLSLTHANQERDKYRKLASLDKLTGLYNRQGIQERYLQRLESQGSLFLIMLDIDNFKHINDTYGHNEGDAILVNLATALSAHLREDAVIGRWGGEEFVVICVAKNHTVATRIAERVRLAIAESQLSLYLRVTCSVGVTNVDKSATLQENLERADKALYQSKQEGKNRVSTGFYLTAEPLA
ncbi:GGDEF domain-containing protein [Vibrio sp. 10N]|uniref:GGDEF domain-containing protein n=1 Tax=Vibrio sp. 10N TaxID=3058938 RepID=UPI002814400B|nr:diguanylate cyclase [Vibrio sp. 10N]